MRKINLCYFLFVGVLVSCTNTYDVCEMQRNETEDMSSRMAGDGVYDVLGFGYVYLANLHTSFLCNLIYPTFSRILLYSC